MVDRASAQTGLVGDQPGNRLPRIPVVPFGIALSAFLALSYLLCVLFLVLFPGAPVSHSFLGLFQPWLAPLLGYDLLMGLIEAIVLGWYVALVFGPLYNFVVSRCER